VPLEPLLPLFHRLNREHFEGTLAREGRPLVALRWSDGRLTRTAGLYRRGVDGQGRELCEIVLSRPLLEPLPHEATLSTLCHEMIHAWVDRVLGAREVHGPLFRARMEAINAAQHAFAVTLRHAATSPAAPAASATTTAVGTPAACWCLSRAPPKFSPFGCGCSPLLLTFLWSLEWGGVTIALVGLGRERWLATRQPLPRR
jgi:hypothetical protein